MYKNHDKAPDDGKFVIDYTLYKTTCTVWTTNGCVYTVYESYNMIQTQHKLLGMINYIIYSNVENYLIHLPPSNAKSYETNNRPRNCTRHIFTQ